MLRLRTYALAVALAAPSLVACGGDDGGNNTPDAPMTPDAPQRNCTAAETSGSLAFDENSSSSYMGWSQEISTDLGTGGSAFLSYEFYDTSLTGTIDLAQQNQYATCTACIVLYTGDADGNIAKLFFQDGGSLVLSQSVSAGLEATATDVSLVEVTIDAQNNYTSTPVVGGTCVSLGSLTLSGAPYPAGWTCTGDKYNDGTTCDCACGAHDPDCDLDAPPVAGCAANQICGSDDTCISTCDVLSDPAVGCTTGTCGFQTADQDICYTDATLVDPATLGQSCASADPLFCAVADTVATGLCDTFENDDLSCRKACDAEADCATGETCAPVVGTKGFCVPKPANDTCAAPVALTLGEGKTGTTGGAASDYNAGLETDTCTGYPQKGGDVVYSVTLAAGTTYTVTVSNVSEHFDPSVAIVGPGDAATVCGAATLACKGGADAGVGGEGETFTYAPTEAGTYFVIVDSFSATQGGAFTLTVAAQ